MESSTKVCRTCKQEKPLNEFHMNRGRKDGHQTQCKECNKQARKQFYEQRPGYIAIESRWKRHRLKQEDYLRMVEKQQGRCFICREEKELHVDHDHETKRVWALLCNDCNLMVGHAKEDTMILAAAIEYLKFFENIPDTLVGYSNTQEEVNT